MKLVIVEGTDRTGKDTLVDRLVQAHRNVVKRHWGFPQGSTNEEKTRHQKMSFQEEFELWDYMATIGPEDMIMFWNRSHVGEFVYGTIYRNSQPEDWVWDLEEEYNMDKVDDVYLVLLYADPEFIVAKEDGKSYSTELSYKEVEISTFLEAFDESKIQRKLKIKVNSGTDYIDKEEIYNQVKSFIHE